MPNGLGARGARGIDPIAPFIIVRTGCENGLNAASRFAAAGVILFTAPGVTPACFLAAAITMRAILPFAMTSSIPWREIGQVSRCAEAADGGQVTAHNHCSRRSSGRMLHAINAATMVSLA